MHSNIWGLCHTTNVQGFKYFVSFIDDCFRVSQLFLRKERFKVSHVFKLFIKKKKKSVGISIGILQSNDALDYNDSSLSSFCVGNEIVHQFSCVCTPQQNGLLKGKIVTC